MSNFCIYICMLLFNLNSVTFNNIKRNVNSEFVCPTFQINNSCIYICI